jgi:hypothetical protein
MTPNQYRLGLLIGHLGRTQKIKTEGATITVAKIAQELEISAQEVTDLLLLAREEGLIELAIASAMVKILPPPEAELNDWGECAEENGLPDNPAHDRDKEEDLKPLDIASEPRSKERSEK